MTVEFIFVGIILLIQIFITIISMKKQKKQYKLQVCSNLFLLIMIALFCIFQIFEFDIRIWPLSVVLVIQSGFSVYSIMQKKEVKLKRNFGFIALRIMGMLGFLLLTSPFLIFPYYKLITPSGPMKFKTTTVTWKNTKDTQPFITAKDGTKYVTVQFWYPVSKNKQEEKKYPFVLFCHGFAMFRNSNLSLMQELASHGYIVGSIDLDYETMWSVHEDKSITFFDPKEWLELKNAKSDKKVDELSVKWDHIRENDMNNAIYHILALTEQKNTNLIFQKIDTNHIAMVGHSYGGSVATSVGRDNPKVKAAINMDGTAYGEIVKFHTNSIEDNMNPYPIPILMMYSQPHYEMIPKFEKLYGDTYPNEVVLEHAKEGYLAKVKGSDHFSFSDMHLNAPLAAIASGATQTRDSKETIKVINHIILNFLDKYLKNEKVDLKKNSFY